MKTEWKPFDLPENYKFVAKYTYLDGRDAYFLYTGVRKVNEEALRHNIFNNTTDNSCYIIDGEDAVSSNSTKDWGGIQK